MQFFLFDDLIIADQLKPFTFTRPVGLIRLGIFTMQERWSKMLEEDIILCASDRLSDVWPNKFSSEGISINAAWIPTKAEVEMVKNLPQGVALVKGKVLLALHQSEGKDSPCHVPYQIERFANKHEVPDAELLTRPWEIFSKNGKVLRSDFEMIREGRTSAGVQDPFTRIYGEENVFVEEGVDIKAAIINATEGPVYLGKNSQVQEGSIIKGPFALCHDSVVNMGAKIRPDTTIGPFCKVGGEINNVVFFGYSNKAHDGFLGNSVIGEWCNLGADTNNSNLKNNYGEVKIYSYADQKMIGTGLLFCGLIMGDHCKTSINSMLNTGTVVGIASNIFDGGFPPKHILSFSWGGSTEGFELHRFEKFIEAERRVFARRKKVISPEYESILKEIYESKKHLPR